MRQARTTKQRLLDRLWEAARAEREASDQRRRARATLAMLIRELDDAQLPPHVWTRPLALILEGTTERRAVERVRSRFRKHLRRRSTGTDVPPK